jgi:protein O-GlcNAc transferase
MTPSLIATAVRCWKGRPADALACYDRTLAIAPDFAEALHNRCGTLRALKRAEEAALCLDRLLAAHPAYAKAHVMRGMMMTDSNRPADAVTSFERAVALAPDSSKARWGACTAVLPILYAEETEIAAQRAEYERRLRALAADHAAERIPADMSKGLGMAQPFFLAYQGHNDRDLQSVFGTLASRIMAARYGIAELAPPPAPGEPIRVGIVSGFFFQHSVWKIGVKGWVTQLDRERFQVFGYHTGSAHDGETEIARQRCQRFVQGPCSTERWRQIIVADRPHVLIYPDIGMSPEPAELAALRLAPLQCGYIGHPQTSGYPTMDCFLSGELIEPPDGDAHYTEKLVRLPHVGFHYEPLSLPPATVTREELGLRPDSNAYWCAQSLFKYLPQHDAVFPRIAKEVGDCQFVFIRRFGREVTELFQRRLERAFAATGLKAEDHCVFLDGMSTDRFAAASAQCDVMLDSIGWSGGNTTLEALAQNLPVVTCEGALMRGRVSAGMLRMMGMPETVAGSIDDFVALAIRIGRDRSWRAEIKARVAADKHRLYRDSTCIVALERFLENATGPRGPAST